MSPPASAGPAKPRVRVQASSRPSPVMRQGRSRLGASLAGGAAGFVFPYESAAWANTETGDWQPQIRSPDGELNQYRDRIVARARDLRRNDGWVSGAVSSILDSTIGSNYRLIANPDHRALALYDKAFDAVWAQEFRQAAEALWRNYADDQGRFNDVTRQLTVSQQFRLILGHKLVDGEGLSLIYWLPERIGPGCARYATALRVVDPDRLCNPYQVVDDRYLRNGVEIDADGVPRAYHIRRAHQNDYYNAVEAMQWDRVPREDTDGFLRVLHDFDRDRADQHRGVSIFSPVLARLKMLARYYGLKLQAANVANAFGTFITSPFDHQLLQEALGDSDDGAASVQTYQDVREAFHGEHTILVNDVRVPILAPGEDIKSVTGSKSEDGFSPFAHEMLRTMASAIGVSAEQVTKDYSEVNYSSARAAIVEAEKTYLRRNEDFAVNTATPFYGTWLQEPFERGELPLPRRSPDYLEARNAYARCRWLGPARGWVDPVAERQGAVLGLDAGFSTLEQQCAEQGMDWEENLEQRARERQRMLDLDLPAPSWMGEKISATDASSPPPKPSPQ